MKRVLITGANGFVGRQCLPFLLASGYEVHAVSRSSHADDDVSWHVCDLFDTAQTNELLARVRPTHLLHLAWNTTHGRYWTALDNLSWVRASLGLFEAFAAVDGRRVVGVGTCAEYAPDGDDACVEHKTPLVPTTLYGTCKHALQLILHAFGKQSGVSTAWARLFFPYGPDETPQRLIPSVTRALLAGEEARCTHGEQVRDFIYVTDAAAALVATLDSVVEGAVNIGSGNPVKLRDLIDMVATRLGRTDLVRMGVIAAPEGEPPALWADVSRLRHEVGWSPRYQLEEGIAETIEWWSKQQRES